jgi:hypothetical protein
VRCASKRCQSPRVEGSRFCARHRDVLASVAAEIEGGKVARLRSPERVGRRRTLYKACDVEGCVECAVPRESYCAAHLRLLNGTQG